MVWKFGKIKTNSAEESVWINENIGKYDAIITAIKKYLNDESCYSVLLTVFKWRFSELERNGFNVLFGHYRVEGLGIPFFYMDVTLVYGSLVISTNTYCSNKVLVDNKSHVNHLRGIKIAYHFKYRTLKDSNIRAELLEFNSQMPMFDIIKHIKSNNGSKTIKCANMIARVKTSVKINPKDTGIIKTIPVVNNENQQEKIISTAITSIIDMVNSVDFINTLDLSRCTNASASVTLSDVETVEELLKGQYVLFPALRLTRGDKEHILDVINISVIKKASYQHKVRCSESKVFRFIMRYV